MGSWFAPDNTAAQTELTAPAIQHSRLRNAASTAYATPVASARTFRTSSVPSCSVTVSEARSAQRPEDLHDENGLAVAFERRPQLAGQRLHDVFVAPEDLRAHV